MRIHSYPMIRLLGLLSSMLSLFLLPMTLRLFSEAFGGETSASSGLWIILVFLFVLTLSSAFVGLKFLKKI